MKIVMIHGQNHKGSTWHVSHLLLQNMSGEKDVQEFFLPKDLNHFCLGCYQCLQAREKCPYWEEKKVLQEAMTEADLLLFTTPNYCMMPSGPLKSFFDLFFTNWLIHKPYPEMFAKKAVVISTTAGVGAAKAAKLVENCLTNWGIAKVIRRGYAVNAMNWKMVPEKKKEKIEKEMRGLGKKLSKTGKVHTRIKTKALFFLYRGMQKAGWGSSVEEKQYWEDHGWLAKKRPWKEEC